MNRVNPDKAEMQSSIAKRFIVYVVVFSSIITLVITAIQLYLDYARDLKGINNRLDQVRRVHVDALTNSLWAADTETLRIQLEGILRMPDMEFLEVSEGEHIWGSAGQQVSTNIIAQQYPLLYESRGTLRTLGELQVVATLDGVYDRLFSKTVAILISNAIKTSLVAGFIIVMFYRFFTRHLKKIAEYVKAHKVDDAMADLLVLDRRENLRYQRDELDVLVDSFNQMRDNIEHSYQSIKEKERKYRQLVELVQEGIWQIDKLGITTYVNPSMANMLGYTVEDMVGASLFKFMDEQGGRLAAKYLQLRDGSFNRQHDFKFIRKDGEPIFTTLSTTPVTTADGDYLGEIAGVVDITQSKLAEDALHYHRMKLEELVTNRTKALELSNRELESFSYSVAHDLRTPLRSIVSFSQILEADVFHKLNSEEQDAFKRIIRAGKNMSGLIDDILELSRISRTAMGSKLVDVSEMAREVAEEVKNQYTGREMNINVAAGLVVEADPVLLRVLLQNLVENACKFSSNNDRATIEVGQKIVTGRHWFYVNDNGVGFNSKYAHKLFYAFQRLHGNDEFLGTGIGLATVQRIVERHGGEVWAESVEGQGATFYFSLEPSSAGGVVRMPSA